MTKPAVSPPLNSHGPARAENQRRLQRILRPISESAEFRPIVATITVTILAVVLVAILRQGVGINDGTTTVALLLVPLLVYGIVSGRLTELTGPGGWGAKLARDLEKTKGQVERQQQILDAIRLTLEGAPNPYEREKLEGLEKDGPFMCYFHDNLPKEMNDLFGLGYVKETEFGSGPRMEKHRSSGQQFDLKEHFVLDEPGKKYLQLWRVWHSQD